MYGFLNRVFSASKNGSWLLPRRLCEGRRYAFTVQVVESERVARKRNSRAPPKTLERIQSGRQVELQTAKVDEDVGVKVASAELSRASEDELRKARRKKLREMISQGRIAAEEEVEQGVKVPIDEDKGKEKEEMQERIPLRVSNIRRKFRGDPYEDPNEDLPVYPRRKKLESRARAIMQRLEKIESLGMINSKRAKVVEKLSYMQAGDVIRLEIKNYQGAGSQFFSGVLIAKKRNGLRKINIPHHQKKKKEEKTDALHVVLSPVLCNRNEIASS